MFAVKKLMNWRERRRKLKLSWKKRLERHLLCVMLHILWINFFVISGGKRGDCENYSVLYCVLKLCTVISTLRWAVLTVLWIGFCLTGSISLCIDSFMFMCLYFVFFHTAYMSYCNTVGCTWWDWSLILRTLSAFSALTLLVRSFNP